MFALNLQLARQLTVPESLELADGLTWIPTLLTPNQQQRLLKFLHSQEWQQFPEIPWHHRLQAYGWRERPPHNLSYFNKQRDCLGTLPFPFSTLRQRLKPWLEDCDQIVAYSTAATCPLTCPTKRSLHLLPPGIHVDHTQNYGNTIATVALSPIKIKFRRGMREPIVVDLSAGEALIMQDAIRYQWLHQVLFEDAVSQTFLTLRTVRIF